MQAFYQAELQPDLCLTFPSNGAALGWLPVGEVRILDRAELFATAMLRSLENVPRGLPLQCQPSKT